MDADDAVHSAEFRLARRRCVPDAPWPGNMFIIVQKKKTARLDATQTVVS